MPRLLLVRHGQASFGAADYDALSPAGHEQARVLGRAFAARGLRPGLILRGGMRRHEETVAGLLDGLGAAVPVVTDPDWNEFDFQHVVEVHRPLDGDHAALTPRAFQEIFEAATARWASGSHDLEYAESFTAFRDRVARALATATARLGEHRDIVAVSSGGPIAMAATLLTAGPSADTPTLAAVWASLNRVTVNTGVTKLIAGRRGLSLSTFNEHPHVEADPSLLTYR
ncbi:histidine phosphatase family protein [Actinoplanes subtropicus]|uniref:histidine phosphatase family protein n=1 Tax=Actinoplanes subtropicus TaxID=543632 RepID=UPI0004C4792C|nr:histidine phosphatase family protein [Actinoplanes subtropicus]